MLPATTRNIFIFLLSFFGMGAIVAGSVLIVSPDGQLIDMPLSTLEGTPFDSFLIPGILIATLLGLIPSVIAIGLSTPKKRNRIRGKTHRVHLQNK